MKTLLRSSVLRDESGQAAVLVATLLFFGFLAFAALAIDGSMIYLLRRDLQNVADSAALSACRVLAQGGNSTAAMNEALGTVTSNFGSFADFVGANPPSTNTGSGAGMLKGISVSDPEVRVALQRPTASVLTQFVGQGQPMVTAQARCDSRAGGGLMPIAIQRYDGEPGGTLTDYIANKSALGSGVYYSATSTLTTWPGRYGPYQVPVPHSPWIAADGAVTDSQTGPEIVILGQSAETNNNEASMRNLVLLDVRNVASVTSLEYYNGADSQANAAKDMSQNWIYQHGYPGPFPQVGAQVAILDGASNAFAAQAMQNAGYRPGDAVAAIVYDGYVWSTPDFDITLTPAANDGISAGYPISPTSAVAYSVKIAKAGAANQGWFNPINFDLSFIFSETALPPDTHVSLDGVELSGPNFMHTINNVTDAGWTGQLRIWSTQAVTQVLFLSGLNVIADSSVGLTHGESTNFGFGPIVSDYALRTNSGRIVVRQGNNALANLITFGVGSAFPTASGGCKNIPVQAEVLLGGVLQNWSSFFSSSSSSTVDIRKTTEKADNLSLSARASAPIGLYTLRLTVSSSTCGPAHRVEIPLEIKPPAPNATPNKFVFIQGYAVFRVSRVDANDVFGYAISPLYQSYEDIRIGLRPRLVPWN